MPAVEYDDLSRGRKQEIDLNRRMAAKRAKEAAAEGPGAGAKIADTATALREIASFRGSGTMGRETPIRQRKLDENAKRAQALADYDDLKSSGLKLFEDASASKEAGARAQGKLNPAKRMEVETEGMKKGGSVKGWGKARGARAAKVY